MYEVMTPDGFKDFSGVFVSDEENHLIKFVLDDGSDICVNKDHLFVVDGLEQKAITLIVGECLETEHGIKTIEEIQYLEDVDNVCDLLEVDGHVYITNGIFSHNCKFIGSTNTLIESDILERMESKNPIDSKWEGLFLIFEQPKEDEFYIMGVDSAEGTGKDYSVIQVLKINGEFDIEQVAIYRNNMIDAHNFSQVCISISEFYNNCYMMVENNNVGSIVAEDIWYEYECDRILNCDKKGLGIRSTRKTKLSSNILLKKYIEEGWLKIKDSVTIYELSLYKEVTPNVFRCDKYQNDDCVSALSWGLFFVRTPFYDSGNLEIKEVDERFKLDVENDSDGPPMAIIDF
jgi:hypothetical protein